MAEPVREIRKCEHCHAVMQPLGKLPAVGIKPLIKVFRCYKCNRVEAASVAVRNLAITGAGPAMKKAAN